MGKWKVNFLLKCLHGARPGSLHPCLWWYRKTCFRSYYLCLLAWWCTPGKIWASTRMSVVYPAFYASSSASCYPVSSRETLWAPRGMAMCQLSVQLLLAYRRLFLKMQVMNVWRCEWVLSESGTIRPMFIHSFIIRLFVKICKTPPADTAATGGYKKFKKYVSIFHLCLQFSV